MSARSHRSHAHSGTARRLRRGLAFLALAHGAAGCASPPAAPEGWREGHAQAPPPPPSNAFPVSPEALEVALRDPRIEVRDVEPIGAGITGALKMVAFYPEVDRVLTTKWKVAADGGTGWNNSPRRVIAAYAVQKWFLDPPDYVVPTTVAVCLAPDALPEPEAPGLPGARCVFGMQAIWLENVTQPERLFDPWRFYRDPHYAVHLANYNLLAHLIRNRDTRAGNYLVSRDETNRRVYAIDNGITFGTRFFNFFKTHWNRIRVPALSRRSIERLRRVGDAEIDALAVVAEFRLGPDGILRETAPTAPFSREQGVRMRDGILQLGLEPGEIEGVRRRLRDLLLDVDEGRLGVF